MSSNPNKKSSSSGDHGYGGYGGNSAPGYGGYGYGGYGYGGYGGYGYGSKRDGALQRTFQDYLLILRERVWYIIVVFLVVFSSALVYTLSQTKIYQATVSLKVSRHAQQVIPGQPVDPDNQGILTAEELNTLIKEIESALIVKKVAQRLTGDDLRSFMAPYETGGANDPSGPEQILFDNRQVTPQRLSLLLLIQYRHPNPQVAAKVANMFAEEYGNYTANQHVNQIGEADQSLKLAVEQQERKVKDLASQLHEYTLKNGSVDSRRDIITQELKVRNELVITAKSRLDEALACEQQLAEYRKAGKDLQELFFISSQGQIASLAKDITSKKIAISGLQQRYKPLHPTMIENNKNLATAEDELRKAVEQAAASVDATYDNAKRNYDDANAHLQEAKASSQELDRLLVDYSELQRQLDINENTLKEMVARLNSINYQAGVNPNVVTVLDPAAPPSEDNYVSPNMVVNLGLGIFGGLGLGMAFAFFVAYIDDRVKSSFDIESVVGVPLIGIIPQIKKMEQPDKAQIVANNSDRQVSEAFLTLHSALRLKDESKNGQCILITSTIPGEGKSFVTTNLALTFAAHGERVVVVDCDLRKPNVHKSFRVENLQGVIDVIAGAATLDDVTIKQLHPNLDVITSGGRAKNPTQVLNSKKFELMISDLRKRYDRIFFDTPPLAAVSDALVILPLVDGALFAIFFNKVRRKAAQFAAQKLLESNVPIYGAILNGLNLAVSGYYYAQYYDKSYKDYYVVMSKHEPEQKG